MPRIVLFPPVDAARFEQIRAAAPRLDVVNACDREAARAAIADAEAFFGKITPDLLAAAHRLRWVQAPTASLEHYVFPELIEHPCLLSNMRGIFSDVIADHVMGLVLCFARNLHHYIRQQAMGRWQPVTAAARPSDRTSPESESDDSRKAAGGGRSSAPSQPFATGPAQISASDAAHLHLADCTLGVVGVGGIGAEVCRRGAAFGMSIVGVDPVTRSVPDVTEDVWPLERLPVLLSTSDFVVIAAPHTPETEKLFHRGQFRLMKRSAYLINIGRGIIVDLTDLDAALAAGDIAGAALDVCEIEPLPTDHSLWRRDNVIITPHVAAASPRIAERHGGVLLENVRRCAEGETPLNLVDKRKWY